jgi:hypothetical protein
MANHVADIPQPMYAYVNSAYLHNHTTHGEWLDCWIYGLSALPGRAWGLSIMMQDGSTFQHLPVVAFSRNASGEKDHYHTLSELQVWSCYGQDFATHEYGALSELAVRAYLGEDQWEVGRYWFTAAPYGDHYARTPDQHKHFNFVWLDCGALASLPGNRLLFSDPSFTTKLPAWGERPRYIVNTRYYYPERDNVFDHTITETSG